MNPADLDHTIVQVVNDSAKALEEELRSDLIFYHGPIHPGLFRQFRNFIEEVKLKSQRTENAISIVLRTGGGSAETVERLVDVLRHHYSTVNFVVPDMAMSAGTIWCMSGDRIYMDYSSALGPIDPQVMSPDGSGFLPALGYLDKVDELTAKSNLSPADAVLLRGIDLAKLALFEQAKNLSIDLLKKWLVEYKFKDWTQHRTTNAGAPVTDSQKAERAAVVAADLADHKRWRSHGRAINVSRLKELRLDIDDYSDNAKLRSMIRKYNDLLTSHIDRQNMPYYFHSHHTEAL
jgi:hypothetical protein